MLIRDVRLVYAPANSVGDFGGDVDNYEWPRHVGDFSFLRAYVGKDGRPADPSPDNVPYHSKDFLVVSAEGLKNGDPILLAGYPGRTSRYKLASEVRAARDVAYPAKVAELRADLDVIAAATDGKPADVVRYASVVKSINNVMKKTQGLIDGFARKDIAAIKDVQDADFRAWYAKQPKVSPAMLAELDAVINARLALEQQKPDEQREPGFQQRDLSFIKARLNRLEQSYVGAVDQARFVAGLRRYAALAPAMHVQGLDALLPAADAVPALYAGTQLGDTARRVGWIDQDAAAIAASDDAFLKLGVKLNDVALSLENRRKEVDGNLERVIPQYMQAVIAWKKSQGKPVYADANSTLRVTFGTVSAYSPRDGVTKGPFTTIEGIAEKNTGKEPFNAPQSLLDAIAQKRYGQFKDPLLGTVPVDFLTSADTTGGNSGSAVMNRRGELIGLNFDSTYESITKDWYFDPAITRAIHLDIRYMLWLMKEVDHADNVLAEMTVKYPKNAKK